MTTKKHMAEGVAKMYDGLTLTKKEAGDLVDLVLWIIKYELVNKGEFSYHSFGKLYTHTRAARAGRNPQTGESIAIPASKTVKFKPAAALKAAVND